VVVCVMLRMTWSGGETRPRLVRVSAATSTEPVRSATGSRVSTSTGRPPPDVAANQISPLRIAPVRPVSAGPQSAIASSERSASVAGCSSHRCASASPLSSTRWRRNARATLALTVLAQIAGTGGPILSGHERLRCVHEFELTRGLGLVYGRREDALWVGWSLDDPTERKGSSSWSLRRV
jgi:hypothetical protein